MSLAKSFIWMTLAEILFNLSGYVVHSGAGRLMTPEDYGRYGLIVTLSIMVVTLIGNGIPISMSKYLSETYEKNPEMVPIIKRSALKAQLLLIGIITIIFYLLSPLIASTLKDNTLVGLFRISVFILPMYAIDSFYFYYYTGIHQFNFQSILKTVRSILRILLILAMIWLWKLKGAIAGYIVVPFLVFLLAWAYDRFKIAKRFPPYNPTLIFDWRKMLRYAWPITLFTIFYEILIALNLYFIKALLQDDYLTGIFNSAIMIARIPYYLFYAMNIIIFPSVSKFVSTGEYEKIRSLISQFIRVLLLVLIPIAALMIAYSASIVNFIFGARYLEAAPVLQVLIFAMSFLTVFYFLSFAINGMGKAHFSMWLAFGGMIMNAILNAILIPIYGLFGSALALSVVSFILLILMLIYTLRQVGHIGDPLMIIKALFGGIVIYALSLFLPGGNFSFLFWGMALTAIFYGLLFAVGALGKNDIDLFLSMIRKDKKAGKTSDVTI